MNTSRITEVNYDSIKTNFIEFLKNQNDFKDLDFESNAVDRIISLLAYNTHYNAFYANAAFKEMFFDTATLRSSVVSHAKGYGYVPNSIKSSKAIVDIRLENGTTIFNENIDLPKGTVFSGKSRDRNNTSLFVTTQNYTIIPDSVDLTFENVELVQGSYDSFDYRVDRYTKNQKYSLPYDNIDTEYLEVYVQDGTSTSSFNRYELGNFGNFGNTDNLYFLQEGVDGKYEIYFGDGIVGDELPHGALVRVVFINSNGASSNNIIEFEYSKSNNQFSNFLKSNFSSIVVSTLSQSLGGRPRETNDEIKIRAPKYRGNGKSALRTVDYEERILNTFPEIESVRVWDASFLENPAGSIGKIFISAIPRNTEFFSNVRKTQILNTIQNEIAGVGKCFEFVDPNLIYAKFNVNIELGNQIKASPDFIKNSVRLAILDYAAKNLNKFESKIELSRISTLIDSIDESIESNTFVVSLETRIVPCINETVGYTSSFINEIIAGSISSNDFEVDGIVYSIVDDSAGNLLLKNVVTNETNIQNFGKVNYVTGDYEIFPTNITRGGDRLFDIRVSANTKNKNILAKNNYVISIDSDNITINTTTINQRNNIKYVV